MSEEYDTMFLNTVVCPECGYKVPEGDAFEYIPESASAGPEVKEQCPECSKEFWLCVEADPKFTTRKIT